MNNTTIERKAQHEALLKDWEKKYEEMKVEGDKSYIFTYDGPCDWDVWDQQKPKILFLLKEGPNEYFRPSEKNPTMIDSNFWHNLAFWKYGINELYHNPKTRKPIFPNYADIKNDFNYSEIALVEVKKLNHGNAKSSDNEILRYAKNDKDLLKKQINFIAPHIVICCGTGNAYSNTLEPGYEVLINKGECSCTKKEDRLAINFFHPSVWNKKEEDLFNLLCEMLVEGKVFEKFAWHNN